MQMLFAYFYHVCIAPWGFPGRPTVDSVCACEICRHSRRLCFYASHDQTDSITCQHLLLHTTPVTSSCAVYNSRASLAIIKAVITADPRSCAADAITQLQTYLIQVIKIAIHTSSSKLTDTAQF